MNKFLFHFTASGCFTSICLASISLSTDIIILKASPNWIYFSFLFFASFLYYNFHKISWYGHYRMLQKNNLKYQWPAQFPGLLLLCLIIGFMGTAALISFSIQNHFQLLFGLLAIIISTIYNQKILGISLRSSKGFKAFTISAVAIIAGVLIPAAQNSFSNTSIFFLILYGLAQLFFIAALCIAADIRDIEEDKEDHIKTFPVAAGLIISKNLIALLLIFQLMLIGISYNLGYLNIAKLEAFMIVSMISILFSRKLNDQKSYFYFIFGVDGLILGQSICILIIS